MKTLFILGNSVTFWLLGESLTVVRCWLLGDLTYSFFCSAGGIFAGVVSDASGKRASTCGVMLVLAAPMVSTHVLKISTHVPKISTHVP